MKVERVTVRQISFPLDLPPGIIVINGGLEKTGTPRRKAGRSNHFFLFAEKTF